MRVEVTWTDGISNKIWETVTDRVPTCPDSMKSRYSGFLYLSLKTLSKEYDPVPGILGRTEKATYIYFYVFRG